MQPTTTNPNSTQTGTDTAYLAPPPGGLAQASSDEQAASQVTSATPQPIAPTATPTAAPAKVNFNVPDLPTYTGNTDIGQFGLDQFSPEKLATFQGNALTKLMNDQTAAQTGAFKQYADASNAQESATDRYNRLSDQYGLPVYQKQMQSIQGLLDRLSDNVTSRVQGTFTTQAQRDRMEAVENKDLNTQLGAIGRYATSAQDNISRVMGFMTQDDQKQLEPIKMFLSTLGETFGRQLSGAQSINSTQATGLQGALKERADQLQRESDAAARQSDEAYRQEQLSLQRQQLALQSRGLSIGGGAGSPAAASAAAGAGGSSPIDGAFNIVKAFRQDPTNRSGGWNAAAQMLQKAGINITRGSAGDIALNKYFNAGGFDDYMAALRREGRA